MKINDKELNKYVSTPEDREAFINNAQRYIKAAEEGRLMCSIERVSKSGMSRKMRFFELTCDKKNRATLYNFIGFMESLGYKHNTVNGRDCFNVRGCGMDMVFATSYDIANTLYLIGFITKAKLSNLEQATPHII